MPKRKFKTGHGSYITQSLFFETANNRDLIVYTLDGEAKEVDGKLLPSLKKLYLDMEDVVEYDFANTCLFDWDHWLKLQENKLLKRHIDKWRRELELKLLSRGVKNLIEHAEQGDRISAQWLAERKFDVAVGKKRTKKEKDEIFKEDSHDSAQILSLVKGTS